MADTWPICQRSQIYPHDVASLSIFSVLSKSFNGFSRNLHLAILFLKINESFLE